MRPRPDGLLERRCGACNWRGYGSAGQRCPNPRCRAPSEDYGPIYRGLVYVHTQDCRGAPSTWTISDEWLPYHIAEELVREGFGRWLQTSPGWVIVTLGDPDRLE